MSTNTQSKLASSVKLVPPEEQPKPPEPEVKIDDRPVARLRYACCRGFYFVGPNGEEYDSGHWGTQAFERFARSHKLANDTGYDLDSWVANAIATSEESAPK